MDAWAKQHPADVKQWRAANSGTPQPKAADLAVAFFTSYSVANPGTIPSVVMHKDADGKNVRAIEPVNAGSDVQSIFFDMWRQDHPDVALQSVPGDFVTASASGLDPDITLANAMFQLDRVAGAWAKDTKRDPAMVRAEIATGRVPPDTGGRSRLTTVVKRICVVPSCHLLAAAKVSTTYTRQADAVVMPR
ncbi:potassium-transporting ATPase subunit C [Paraburkholderia denitrificans]|uniref:Potassium-transporting ATPase subunit C n=1 Tax=Paraburkholderia denitrificans TaxID=694025 RepID=A0ABW0JDY4_9BURK